MNESDATDLLTALYDRWYMALVRYALRTTCNYELAEDLAQDTFMQLYQALRSGKRIEHPKAWTICVLRRAMNRQMKYRNLHEQLDELERLRGFSKDDLLSMCQVDWLFELIDELHSSNIQLKCELSDALWPQKE